MDNKVKQDEISQEIEKYSKVMARMISNGNSIEIHPCKDNHVKVMEVRKKVVK